MIKKQLVLSIIVLLLSSCTRIINLYFGVHKPRNETKETITRFLVKNEVYQPPALMVKMDSMLTCLLNDMGKTYIFDKSGYSIIYNQFFDNQTCSGNILKLIPALTKETYYPRDSLKTINTEKFKWVYIKNEIQFSDDFDKEIDYIVVYYWNLFCGRPNNKIMMKDLIKSVNANNKVNIKLIFVNQDIREGSEIIIDAKIK